MFHSRDGIHSYYVGVDLGQRQDYTAVPIIEEPAFVGGRALEPPGWTWRFGVEETGWISPATLHSTALREARTANKGRPADVPLSLRHLERLPLDTPYPQIVERVKAMLSTQPLAGRPSALVVDATGVGISVVDQFAAAALHLEVVAEGAQDWLDPTSLRLGLVVARGVGGEDLRDLLQRGFGFGDQTPPVRPTGQHYVQVVVGEEPTVAVMLLRGRRLFW